jgi:hypothetical protein
VAVYVHPQLQDQAARRQVRIPRPG